VSYITSNHTVTVVIIDVFIATWLCVISGAFYLSFRHTVVVEDCVQPTRTYWQLVRLADITLLMTMCSVNFSQLCVRSKLTVNRFVAWAAHFKSKAEHNDHLSCVPSLVLLEFFYSPYNGISFAV